MAPEKKRMIEGINTLKVVLFSADVKAGKRNFKTQKRSTGRVAMKARKNDIPTCAQNASIGPVTINSTPSGSRSLLILSKKMTANDL
jgi:hypothetical protein